ncbi:Scr1 family TA system antitoxin-like transcriptional regulator [Micromonospora sp. NPDC047548]|uniref:Scr1 family TA system antitoxin-like transcriptional regulator n=1 Tax=Micromonospora sp. NPDC047548 TaxID=3155624 RepID=UPI0033D4674E
MDGIFLAPAGQGHHVLGDPVGTPLPWEWHAYGDAVPSWFELYVGLESAAATLRRYDESLIPGLLQTRQYAQAIYRLDRPASSEEDRERAVEVRLQRQSLLTRRLPAAPQVHQILSPGFRSR